MARLVLLGLWVGMATWLTARGVAARSVPPVSDTQIALHDYLKDTSPDCGADTDDAGLASKPQSTVLPPRTALMSSASVSLGEAQLSDRTPTARGPPVTPPLRSGDHRFLAPNLTHRPERKPEP